MICKKCGKENQETAKFCSGCGSSLKEKEAVVENDKNSVSEMKNTIGKTFVEEFLKKMHDAGVSNNEIITLVKEAIGEN